MDYKEKVISLLNSKELSEEQKAKLEKVFPELKESEGGRVMRELIDYFGGTLNGEDVELPSKDTMERWIAWLEKQGEQKPLFKEGDIVIWDGEEFNVLDVTKDSYNVGGYIIPIYRQNELSLKQKPAEEIEPTPIFRIGDILKRKGKDYTFRVDRIQGGYYHCDRNNGAFFPIEEQGNWELIEPKQEWGERDEDMLKSIIATCELAEQDRDSSPARHLFEMQADWLKSLKDRKLTPKGWKPSEGHIMALADAMEKYSGKYSSTLCQLYNELKNLTK